MALVAEGREAAFGQLVQRHEGAVRSLCNLLLKDEQQARDVAQEVFLRVWRSRERYRPDGKLRVWLFTLARNLCHSASRRRRVLSFLGLEEAHESAAATEHPAELLLSAESGALVRRALQQLPEKFRLPLSLRFVEGLDYDAIAEIIGRTPSAARSRVHYGLKELQKLLPPEVCP